MDAPKYRRTLPKLIFQKLYRAQTLTQLKRREKRRKNRDYTVRLCFIIAVLSVTFAVGSLGALYNVAISTLGLASGYAADSSSEPLYSPDIPMEKLDEAAIGSESAATEAPDAADSNVTLISTKALDLSYPSLGEWYYSNETGYQPNLAEYIDADYPVESPSYSAMSGETADAAPLVLILHTHATEAYSDSSDAEYPLDYTVPRSTDITKNVVAVGEVMTEILNASGIPTIHCTVLHDAESFVKSYENSRATILEYLERYPTIKYVFDVHRDSINTSDGAVVRSLCTIGGVETAQVMSVVGTDYKGGNHPSWTNNLTLAVKLQAKLKADYPSLCRPINLRCATFNEQYTDGSLLLEVGSAGNTLDEAKRAGILLASAIAGLINENE